MSSEKYSIFSNIKICLKYYDCVFNVLNWSLMNDLNVRPSGPKPDALPD